MGARIRCREKQFRPPFLALQTVPTRAEITQMYDAASTSQANGHMEDVHRIYRCGKMCGKKQRTILDMVDFDSRHRKDQAVMNALNSLLRPTTLSTVAYSLGGLRQRPFQQARESLLPRAYGIHKQCCY